MTDQKPTILITTPALQFVEPSLQPHYSVVRAWEAGSDQHFPQVRTIVCLGNEDVEGVLGRCPSAGLIACYTTGYDAIDIGAARRRGVLVSHAPGATSYAVAEFAIALILAAFRNVVVGDRRVRAGEWRPGQAMVGRSLAGARLGVVGLGDIGAQLSALARALGMDVAWWGPRPKPEAPWPRAASLIELARGADVLAICARSDPANRHLIDAAVIDAVGPTGLIVNVGRGQLIDEDALLAALHEGRLGGAALDVFEAEPTPPARWADAPGAITTPHIAGGTLQSTAKMTEMLLANLAAFYAGRPLATPVPADS
ncbi:MAG TPA: NAD(P)-dependent oxidoreductase [Phenylobacterium sp.]|uniref:NAD(P)-dependent oxidoreductase n=1 Tax=Phenylobacterium sp. TaxID=1871053 RepID=UPI002B47704E|nr:NAD(P)-dependent oxidoreductase [Phenylobacterium sp.]HKR86778.1 NAD(P)-dependent oxidoreductase [Phenylobacterium sp.]HKT53281.1 NAD(P)-dependent oxidoreductase [Caulobacteraceae bacterium]